MIKRLLIVSVVIPLLLLPISTIQAQQDPPHISCCFWVYSAGLEMGILKSTAAYNTAADAAIIQLLFRIGEWVQRANISCSKLSPAWPGYVRMREELDYYADWLARDPSERVQDAIYDFASRAQEEYILGLVKVGVRDSKIKGERYRTSTCEQWYFQIGYFIGFAHHAFQVAAQTPNSEIGKDARRMGLDHISKAVDVLYSLRATRPWTGYCVALWSPQMPILRPFQDVAQEITRPYEKFTNIQLVGITWLARRAIAAVFGDPSAGPVPAGVAGCPGVAQVLSKKGRWAQNQRWLGNHEKLMERMNKLNKKIKPMPIPETKPEPKETVEKDWEGTWTLKSTHTSGPTKGVSVRTRLKVLFEEQGVIVYQNNDKAQWARIEGKKLIYYIEHPDVVVTVTLNLVAEDKLKGTFEGYKKSYRHPDQKPAIAGIYEGWK